MDGLFGVLTILFVVLKLCGVITWSWWLVFLPIIVGLLAMIVSFFLVVICIFLRRLILK